MFEITNYTNYLIDNPNECKLTGILLIKDLIGKYQNLLFWCCTLIVCFYILYFLLHCFKNRIIKRAENIEEKIRWCEWVYTIQLLLVILSFICALLILQIVYWAK